MEGSAYKSRSESRASRVPADDESSYGIFPGKLSIRHYILIYISTLSFQVDALIDEFLKLDIIDQKMDVTDQKMDVAGCKLDVIGSNVQTIVEVMHLRMGH